MSNKSPSLQGSMSVKERLALLNNNCKAKNRTKKNRKPLVERNASIGDDKMDELKNMLANCMLRPSKPPVVPKVAVPLQVKRSVPKKAASAVDSVQRKLQMLLASECSEKMSTVRLRKQQIRKMRVANVPEVVTAVKSAASAESATTGNPIDRLFELGHATHFLSFLDTGELICSVSRVCSTWDKCAVETVAREVAARSVSTGKANVMKSWVGMIKAFPWGKFLGEGGFKDVYEVWSSRDARREAVSVMDVIACKESGEQAVVQQEVFVGFLLSDLVLTGRCPNFVQVYESFLFAFQPPSTIWGTAKNRNPKGEMPQKGSAELENFPPALPKKLPKRPARSKEGVQQYTRMELCTAGDLEELLKRQPGQCLPAAELPAMVWQMAFSLFVGREQHRLRHYDVKLLNFFARDLGEEGSSESAPDADADADANTDADAVVLRYEFADRTLRLAMPRARAYLIKLADYGTADTNPRSLDAAVTAQQFGTLENTPPDWLAYGGGARQGYAADTFALGLCLLHLFTGKAPYEELLEDVRCPRELRRRLLSLWRTGREPVDAGNTVEDEGEDEDEDEDADAAESEEDDDGETGKETSEGQWFAPLRKILRVCDGAHNTLPDTLYRLVVLFGLPASTGSSGGAVWSAVRECLVQGGCDCDAFAEHQVQYSIATGNNRVIAACRSRLGQIQGAEQLLRQMVAWEAAERPTMKKVLASEFFQGLVVCKSEKTSTSRRQSKQDKRKSKRAPRAAKEQERMEAEHCYCAYQGLSLGSLEDV